jgi:alanine-glyoxylate transaminase/serine-glyoxylate transaminase/serine-pyruvate transaminase
MMDETKELIRYAFQSDYSLAMPVSAPGSAGMETCFVNLLEPGDKVVICQNGVFGGRMKENAERCGAVPIMVEDDWGLPVDLNKVEETLKANSDAKVLAFVQAETSTGAISDVEGLAKLAMKHD